MCSERNKSIYFRPMPDGYYPDHSDEQLDEFLCEYVDGTMDPSVRVAFEEYLEANPGLANHARCLCRTRNMLCSYAGRHPSESLQQQIRHRVACELNRKNRNEAVILSRLGSAAMLTSAVSLLLILGMVAGISAVNESGSGHYLIGSESALVESMALPNDAYGQPGRRLPLDWYKKSPTLSSLGPATILPTIDMIPVGWNIAPMDSVGDVFRLLVTP